jgi:hypothetical protein
MVGSTDPTHEFRPACFNSTKECIIKWVGVDRHLVCCCMKHLFMIDGRTLLLSGRHWAAIPAISLFETCPLQELVRLLLEAALVIQPDT